MAAAPLERTVQHVYKVLRKGGQVVWTVPCFPVLKITFTTAIFEDNGEILNGLMNSADMHKMPDFRGGVEIVCWSRCDIDIQGTTYVVLWSWEVRDNQEELETRLGDITHISESSVPDSSARDNSENSEDDIDQDIDSFPEVTHTLPFKVIGVTHSKTYQLHLEKAFEKMGENNGSVTAHIMPEPDNEKDSEAICVKVDYGKGQFRIGYIAKELTKYIHPLMRNNKIIKVRIGKIKFQTQWLRIGFYLSILITRNGEWENFVVNAARHVKLY